MTEGRKAGRASKTKLGTLLEGCTVRVGYFTQEHSAIALARAYNFLCLAVGK